MTVKDMIKEYIDSLKIGDCFYMRDICQSIYIKTMGKRNPLDGSVSRIVRELRTACPYDIVCVDRPKALYRKVARTCE